MKAIKELKPIDYNLFVKKISPDDKVIAIAGNPNVGKSTVFNGLTGMNQHTGNWPGKTVTNTQGYCMYNGARYVLVDIPGTYSLMAHSAEEEVARNFICFGRPDAVIVVCDATCLERNFNLLLQTLEITDNVVACVNLMDEAKKKNIRIDLDGLSQRLGIPVVGTVARQKESLDVLMASVSALLENRTENAVTKPEYEKPVEDAIALVEQALAQKAEFKINPRWLSLKLLDYDEKLVYELNSYLNRALLSDVQISSSLESADRILKEHGITKDELRDRIVKSLVLKAEELCADTVDYDRASYNLRDRRIDKILLSKYTGFPIMLLLLMGVFWLTISGANYPSQLLSDGFFWLEEILTDFFAFLGAPDWLHGVTIHGIYRVPAWVVAVMLPPMAIFFPLFTLLEDLGYLPRVAFNLDKYFKKCHACGKQALTMCMGFGCNAAGVIGCRIIDSPRERLIAIITNNFVPCNGRFPTLIAILTMFFIGVNAGGFNSLFCAALLTVIIVLGVLMTLGVSKLLTKTILKGIPSSFTLELPPYRRPQIMRVIFRSIFDRTLFVLGRAVAVSVPAGVIIWLMANINVYDTTLLAYCADILHPFAELMGLDGVILLAFILGFPANEIIIPIIIMAYMKIGYIVELDSLIGLKALLVDNGWTWITAISTMLFSLFHWPCSTTCLTIMKETQSLKWTFISFIVPSAIGIAVCILFTTTARLFV